MVNWYRVMENIKDLCPEGTKDVNEALRYLYEDMNMSLAEITALTNNVILCPHTLSTRLRKIGVNVRRKGGKRRVKNILLAEDDFEKFSAIELAKKHGVHVTTIYNRKKKLKQEA